MVKNL